mmetsp:Transcript_86977/g.231144  ORF Transcript_86977/g.231144 Transcript_86977/m.231144 type:complete len:120 (+) Transcript_86977:24-383(+)
MRTIIIFDHKQWRSWRRHALHTVSTQAMCSCLQGVRDGASQSAKTFRTATTNPVTKKPALEISAPGIVMMPRDRATANISVVFAVSSSCVFSVAVRRMRKDSQTVCGSTRRLASAPTQL